jgi:hypothetical protein
LGALAGGVAMAALVVWAAALLGIKVIPHHLTALDNALNLRGMRRFGASVWALTGCLRAVWQGAAGDFNTGGGGGRLADPAESISINQYSGFLWHWN